MEDVNYGSLPPYDVAGRAGDLPGYPGDAARDRYATVTTKQEQTNDPLIEGELHNPLLTDCIEEKTDDDRRLEHDMFYFLKAIHVPEPQIMRRFILACMEKNVFEKDLLWMYHMRDLPQHGTLPKDIFKQITKQQLAGNAQLTTDKDYDILAEAYRSFTQQGDHIRYVTMCNHLHAWRVQLENYKEFPLKQIYPSYRYPQKYQYPLQRPAQGDWHMDGSRREPHTLPTITMDELVEVPGLIRKMASSVLENHKFRGLERLFYQQEERKEDKSIDIGLVPHDFAKQILVQQVPFVLSDKEMQIVQLYYEHPYILHFFRYRDFLLDLKFEMGDIDPKFKETPEQVKLTALLSTIKRYVHNSGINMIEPLKDYDTFREGRLNKSQTKRALHLLRIGPGQRCNVPENDMEFLLNSYSQDGTWVNYRAMVGEIMQVFVERFEPSGRLAMVLESFEPTLSRGPFYPPRAPLLTRKEILTKPSSNQQLLDLVINRLKMLVAERRMCLEPVFKSFDPHHIRYVQTPLTVPRILQVAYLPVTPDEADVIIERFTDEKGFRYMEFLQAIDTKSFPYSPPTYPLTVATMEKWKARRSWYGEAVPQDPYQDYQGPEAVMEKCRRNVAINRLRVSDFFTDQDFHHRGTVTRKQFRRCTGNMRLGLSPMENLILEDRYVYSPDLMHVDFLKFIADMDQAFAPTDPASSPAVVPQPYILPKLHDRNPIGEGYIELAQEGFRKITEKLLELRIHIWPYFQDWDYLRHGTVAPGRFRRILNDIGLDFLTEFEWNALNKYFTRRSDKQFDYQAFMNGVASVEASRKKTAAVDPRLIPASVTKN